MHNACDALFASLEGGRCFEVFLLGCGEEEESALLGHHVVDTEALLRAMPALSCGVKAPRFLVRAEAVLQRLETQGLRSCDCPCAALVWTSVLDQLKTPKVTREALQSRIQALQMRFVRLATLGQEPANASTDTAIIAAELGGLLDDLGLRRMGTGRALHSSEREVDDMRRIGLNPGKGITALSNGVKVLAGLQQLLQARHPGPVQSEGRQEELLLHAFGQDPSACQQVTRQVAQEIGSAGMPERCSSGSPETATESPMLRPGDTDEVASGVAGTEASTVLRRADPPISPSERQQLLQRILLPAPSSWQGKRPCRWSQGSSTDCSADTAGASQPSQPSQQSQPACRGGSEPRGRKPSWTKSTPRTPRVPSGRDAHFNRLRARATRSMSSKSPDPGVAQAVKRAQRRAWTTQRRHAEEEEADIRDRIGPAGDVVPAATAKLFKRRNERLQRFVEKQNNVHDAPRRLTSAGSVSSLSTVVPECPQPAPRPEPLPL
mmetsp:Transcript_5847/g.13516  ORF Transcript_5847/g.13516 Transcript_5847/m.13516 type:complete len:493 (+) Transcript_5847:80-1558(+)